MSDPFTIHIEGHFELDRDDIWPDGDGPDEPTVDDVLEVIQKTTHGPDHLIREWHLRPVEVSVTGPVVRQSGTEMVAW